MAKWKEDESLSKAIAREGGQIVKGVGSELLSIATLGLFAPEKRGEEITVKYPDGRIVKIKR
jgi:hypothetical protein